MTKIYKIAHIHRDGVDIIIIPLDSGFLDSISDKDKESIRNQFQLFAANASLKGIVCLVWQTGNLFKFIAPPAWHLFFRSINMSFVHTHINRDLIVSELVNSSSESVSPLRCLYFDEESEGKENDSQSSSENA